MQNMSVSMDEDSSSPLESGGKQARPSAIETIVNDQKPNGHIQDDDDDDDYEDDYDDDEFWDNSQDARH